MPLRAKGEFAPVIQNMAAALKVSGQPVRSGTMAHEHDVFMFLTDSAAQQRDQASLREYAPRLQELAERDEHKLYLPIAWRAWGVAHRLAGEHAQATTSLNRALELFDGLGARWQSGRTRIELAELALACSDPDAARLHYSEALADFESLKAAPDVQRTRVAMDTMG
jgi:hypothetical protein